MDYKPASDALTMCASVISNCKINILFVCHSENPREFKPHKILREKLQVMWRANPRAWITGQFFVEWVNFACGPDVKKYLQENNLLLQALLVLDNPSAHLQNLKDDMLKVLKVYKGSLPSTQHHLCPAAPWTTKAVALM